MYLLGRVPHLVEAVGHIRWTQWGRAPGREDLWWWVEVTAREAGCEGLPVAFVAVDSLGEAVGAFGLGEFDID